MLSWRWCLTRLKIASCLYYEWCWNPKWCLLGKWFRCSCLGGSFSGSVGFLQAFIVWVGAGDGSSSFYLLRFCSLGWFFLCCCCCHQVWRLSVCFCSDCCVVSLVVCGLGCSGFAGAVGSGGLVTCVPCIVVLAV